jgi:hypothetical protein
MTTGDDRATTWARRALVAVLAIATVEWGMAAWAYRDPLDDAAWSALADDLAAVPADEPVVLASEWLGPSARMHVPALARIDAVERPDLRGWSRFHTVGFGTRWSEELAADLEDLPAPTRTDTREVGPFTITTYELAAAGTLVADLLGDVDALEVEDDAGRCRGRGELRCGSGTIALRGAEIDYRPRRCLALDVRDGASLRIARMDTPTGDVIRGHVGFANFNARLRNDSPVALRVEIDGELVAQWTVTDAQGWWPFAIAVEPGAHDVAFVVDVGVGGRWTARGYDAADTRTVCLDARTLQEGA